MSKGSHDIGNCLTIKHIIRLTINISIVGKIEYYIPKEHKWIKDQVKIILENRVIKESNSPYVFNVVIIRKKDKAREGMNKLYVNYGLLNKITISDKYSLLNINEIYNRF